MLVKRTTSFLLGLAAFTVVVTSGVKAQKPAKFDGSVRILTESRLGNLKISSKPYEEEITAMRNPIMQGGKGKPTPKTLASTMDSLIFLVKGSNISKKKDIHLYEAEIQNVIECDILTFKIVDAAQLVGMKAKYLIKSGHYAALVRVPGGEWHKLEMADGHIVAVPYVQEDGDLATADVNVAMCAVYENYGRRAMSRGDYGTAKSLLGKAIKLAPNASQLYTTMGKCLIAQNDTLSAFGFYKKAVETNPESYLTNYNMARLFQWKGDLQAALIHARKAYGLEPNANTLSLKIEIEHDIAENKVEAERMLDAMKYYQLGLDTFAGGKYEQAVIALEMALKIDPKKAEADSALVDAYDKLGYTRLYRGHLEWNASIAFALGLTVDYHNVRGTNGGPLQGQFLIRSSKSKTSTLVLVQSGEWTPFQMDGKNYVLVCNSLISTPPEYDAAKVEVLVAK